MLYNAIHVLSLCILIDSLSIRQRTHKRDGRLQIEISLTNTTTKFRCHPKQFQWNSSQKYNFKQFHVCDFNLVKVTVIKFNLFWWIRHCELLWCLKTHTFCLSSSYFSFCSASKGVGSWTSKSHLQIQPQSSACHPKCYTLFCFCSHFCTWEISAIVYSDL